MLSDRSNQSSQAEAAVEPIESVGVEVVAPIPIPEYVYELVTRAKGAAGQLATLSTTVKNRALLAMAEALEAQTDALLAANELDLEAFGAEPEKKAMADRLRLTAKRIVEMAAGLREVAALLIRSATCRRCGPGRTGCRWGVCGFRSASLGLFMSLVRTSRRIPPPSVEVRERLRTSGWERGDPFEYGNRHGPIGGGGESRGSGRSDHLCRAARP